MELPRTSERVPRHTAAAVNQAIAAETERRVKQYSGKPEAIEGRLEELEREWDIERTLEANAASVSLAGLLLGATVDRKFFVLPAVVAGFLLQHALQGWCPPLALFRRFGVRTQREIDEERYALKAMRGDFENVRTRDAGDTVDRTALRAARA